MARALILAIMVLALSACQTASQKLATISTQAGQTRAAIILPELPDACTAYLERVYPKLGEKARWTQKRWEFIADNHDREADDCRKWWSEFRGAIAQIDH